MSLDSFECFACGRNFFGRTRDFKKHFSVCSKNSGGDENLVEEDETELPVVLGDCPEKKSAAAGDADLPEVIGASDSGWVVRRNPKQDGKMETRFRLVDFSDAQTDVGDDSRVVGTVGSKWVVIDMPEKSSCGTAAAAEKHCWSAPVDRMILNVDGAFDASDSDDDDEDVALARVVKAGKKAGGKGGASAVAPVFEGVFIKEEQSDEGEQDDSVDPIDYVEVSVHSCSLMFYLQIGVLI